MESIHQGGRTGRVSCCISLVIKSHSNGSGYIFLMSDLAGSQELQKAEVAPLLTYE